MSNLKNILTLRLPGGSNETDRYIQNYFSYEKRTENYVKYVTFTYIYRKNHIFTKVTNLKKVAFLQNLQSIFSDLLKDSVFTVNRIQKNLFFIRYHENVIC